jgi:hypothetical protein
MGGLFYVLCIYFVLNPGVMSGGMNPSGRIRCVLSSISFRSILSLLSALIVG